MPNRFRKALAVGCLACNQLPGRPCFRETREGRRVSLLRPHWQRFVAANVKSDLTAMGEPNVKSPSRVSSGERHLSFRENVLLSGTLTRPDVLATCVVRAVNLTIPALEIIEYVEVDIGLAPLHLPDGEYELHFDRRAVRVRNNRVFWSSNDQRIPVHEFDERHSHEGQSILDRPVDRVGLFTESLKRNELHQQNEEGGLQ